MTHKGKNSNKNQWQQIGIAAMLPGMVHMVELMQGAVNQMRDLLGSAKNTKSKSANSQDTSSKSKAYWAKMTPAQRKAEMTRRIAKRLVKKETKIK